MWGKEYASMILKFGVSVLILFERLTTKTSIMNMIKMMLLAGTGGFLGTCLRFLTGRLCTALGATLFPWGTFVVNVVGSFVIGLLFGYAERTTLITAAMNALLITGFCGGFTTFSSFSHDMLTLIEHRHYLYFGLYAVLSFALGLLMVWLGREVVMHHS